MDYIKRFNPPMNGKTSGPRAPSFGDRGAEAAYIYSNRLVLAVNVALAAGRPLLVRGPSGVGKSSLARSASSVLGWSHYQLVVTGRTEARDFLWRVDHVRRLRDAQLGSKEVESLEGYVVPGPLFWAFAPDLARRLLTASGRGTLIPPGDRPEATDAVVLIDEIDKAEPDVPNGLLEPLGVLSFEVEDIGWRVEASRPPLIIITTNEERDLPQAFVRRCIEVAIDPPDVASLLRIGRAHFPDADEERLAAVADLCLERARAADVTPSIAEYLDTVRACGRLGAWPGSEVFELILQATVLK